MDERFAPLAEEYRDALLQDVIPFWVRHSIDRECGGFFSCLDRDGSVYDTDKFVWLQAREVWMFAFLYEELDQRGEWLDIARDGAAFLRAHGRDREGNWYFALARDGRPLVQPYNIFSDCFAAMAFARYARAAGDDEARRIAEDTYRNILSRRANPKGVYGKGVPGARPMISMALPMILINLTLDLEWLLDAETRERVLDECVREVLGRFLDPKRNILHEHVAPDGRKLDCYDGRLINPGHGLEATWFLMKVAERRDDRAMMERVVDIAL